MTRPQAWALRTIGGYQRVVQGRPSPCRFTPSCSSFAHEAFSVHGTRRGLWLTVRRLLRCRPFGPSGYDPVPDVDHAPAVDRPPPASSSPTTVVTSFPAPVLGTEDPAPRERRPHA